MAGLLSPSARKGRGMSPNTMTLFLESRLPVALRRDCFELEKGAWRQQPPTEVGSYSMASWTSEPKGFLGRQGVKGAVRYHCYWGGKVSILHIFFECLLFGDRRLVCREETSEGNNCRSEDRIFCIHCQASENGSATSISNLHVVVELQEHLAKHVNVEQNRLKSASAAENLRGGRLATVLRQATRSCLIRITNLTPYRLAMDGRGAMDAQGFWVAQPSACINSHTFFDMGISNNGLQLSTRGSLCYVVESPQTNRERRVQVTIHWEVPWFRQKSLKAKESGDVFAVRVFADRANNLVGLVHIVDPRNLPPLEILDAVALASNTDSGEDMTELVQSMALEFELVIPSVRVLLGRAKRIRVTTSEESTENDRDWYTGLQISYRIGPEVFRRVYSPSERVHLSAAQPGGDGEEDTVLAALEARGAEAVEQKEIDLGPQDQALLLQRYLADGIMPAIRVAFRKVPKNEWPDKSLWWPSGSGMMGEPDPETDLAEVMVLDACGVLQVLRRHWAIMTKRHAAAREVDADALLNPLDDLVDAWTHQADLEPSLITRAAESGATLCRVFGAEEMAANIEGLLEGRMAPRSRKSLSPQKEVHKAVRVPF